MGKNILAVLVIAALCMSLFVACDDTTDNKNVGKATTVSGAATENTTVEATNAVKTVIVEIDPDTVTDKNGIPVTDKKGKTMINKNAQETTASTVKTIETKEITTTSKEEKTKKPKKTKKGATTEYTFETAENGDIWSPAY